MTLVYKLTKHELYLNTREIEIEIVDDTTEAVVGTERFLWGQDVALGQVRNETLAILEYKYGREVEVGPGVGSEF